MKTFRHLAIAVALAIAGSALINASTVVKRVFPGSWEGWFLYDDNTDTIDNSLGEFVLGPGNPPLGVGSLEIATIGSGRPNVATYQFAGTPLASITELSFDTYNSSEGNPGNPQRSAYLHFNVDFDGTDTWQRRLVYVPRLNGTVLQNTWQHWDTIIGGSDNWLYSGSTWPGGVQSGSTPKTWNQVLADYPGVRIRVADPFLGLRVGEPYTDGFVGNVDNISFGTAEGTVSFNFDPKGSDLCKKNAWASLTRSNGTPFANQGDCVSYVNTGN